MNESQSTTARRQLKVAKMYAPTEVPTTQTPLEILHARSQLAIAMKDQALMLECFNQLTALEPTQ